MKVSYLLRQYASGCYPLQHGYLGPQHGHLGPQSQNRREEDSSSLLDSGERERVDALSDQLSHHQFTVQVEGIRALEVAANTVWGEADCFIQYHFPTLSEDSDAASEIGQFPRVADSDCVLMCSFA